LACASGRTGTRHLSSATSIYALLPDENAERDSDLRVVDAYAPASFDLIAVTPPTSKAGIPFEIAVPVGMFRRTRSTIDREKLERLGSQCEDESVWIPLRSFRTGLTARDPFRTLIELWTAAESLAERQARTDGRLVEQACDCGRTIRTTPASQHYIREFFEAVTSADKTCES
jgi:hypothetical protein